MEGDTDEGSLRTFGTFSVHNRVVTKFETSFIWGECMEQVLKASNVRDGSRGMFDNGNLIDWTPSWSTSPGGSTYKKVNRKFESLRVYFRAC